MKEIAPELAVVPLKIANVYLVGSKALWYLVDTGLPGEEQSIKKAVEARFGPGTKPAAIVLTHGHPDHAGSALSLADDWDVKVLVAELETPYVSFLSAYPPPDPTGPGFLAFMSRFFASPKIDLGARLAILAESDPFPGLSGWRVIPTPGHSPGHVSYFRDSDGVLLAGDAFTTMNTESLVGIITKKPKLCRPPVPSTLDWPAAKASVQTLAQLKPSLLAAGHGKPLADTSGKLQKLADTFQQPSRGRYVQTPVQSSDRGILLIPPAPADHFSPIAKSILVVGLAAGIGTAYPAIRKRLKKK